jgi:hypothetical protein
MFDLHIEIIVKDGADGKSALTHSLMELSPS